MVKSKELSTRKGPGVFAVGRAVRHNGVNIADRWVRAEGLWREDRDLQPLPIPPVSRDPVGRDQPLRM